MSKAVDINTRLSAALPELPPEVIIGARKNFGPSTPIRQILAVEIKRLIETRRNTLEKVLLEDLKKEQGAIEGIRELAGAIDALFAP